VGAGLTVEPAWSRRWLEADARLSARLRLAEQPRYLHGLAALLAHSGDSWYWFAGLALIWWLGGAAWRVFVVQLVVGILATAAVVIVIKFAVRRRRPEGSWGAFYRWTDPNSFPSGHAARMAALAVAGFAFGHPGFGLALLIWAPLVALARVALGVHYVSDVVGGLVIGLGVGLLVMRVW
jgi:membrane-associated phospholipid phosphatase